MKKINLKISGMHCKSCEVLISDALLEAGAKKVAVDSKKSIATIEFDESLSEEKIKQIIRKEGYQV